MPSRSNRPSHVTRGGCGTSASNQVILERVLGFTSASNCALSIDLSSGTIAYAAGCVVVLRTLEFDGQRFIQSSSKKAITAVEFSPDGKMIATGESGHHPMVRLWSVADGNQLAEFSGHHFRVIAVRFSPCGRYIVSVGSKDDNTIYVWDRATGQRVASAKVTNKINGVAFSPKGRFFVTVGVRHVRYWYLEAKRVRNKEILPLNGRNAILGDLLHNTFMDVCCISAPSSDQQTNNLSSSGNPGGQGTLTMVISKAGHLMQFSDQRFLDKWVELRTSRANCLSVHKTWVLAGCANGTCLLFDAVSLQFIAQLPLPHHLGSEPEISNSSVVPTNSEQSEPPIYPDLLALQLDRVHSRVICFYVDHSVYVWDITDLSCIRRTAANFYHSRGVWSVDCFSQPCRDTSKDRSTFHGSLPSWWSDSTFVTGSDDGTIRFWNLKDELEQNGADMTTSLIEDSSLLRSTFSRTKEKLAHIIFTDPTYKFLCVGDRVSAELSYAKFEGGVGPLGGPPSPSVGGQVDSAAPSPSSPTVPSLDELSSCSQSSIQLTSNGCCVRVVSLSPDGQHLAAGDRDGVLRIYALSNMEPVGRISAHDSEILSLNFFRSDTVPELALLCSASRDRLIHIFDPNQDYSLVQTVADHSGAIFAARIVETEDDGEIRLISCGMDKSLLIRVLEPDEAGLTAHFALEHHLVGRCSQLDAAVTPTIPFQKLDSKPCKRKRYLAVACQDRRLRIYNISTGRQLRCYRGSFNEDGCLMRCAIDPTGSVVITSGSDKQLNLFHLLSGESITPLFGHSELVLGLRFLPDLCHLVTVSADSCIFIWRLATDLTRHLNDRSSTTRRPSSCSNVSMASTMTSSKRPKATIRFHNSFRGKNGQSYGEDSTSLSFLPSWNDSPTEYDQTDELDEDSEIDLLRLDTDELLPRDSCLLARIRRPNDAPDLSDCEDHASSISHDSCQTAKSAMSDQKSCAVNKPAFYFSVSALPAWARRKLSRRSSVALVPPSVEQISLATHPELQKSTAINDHSSQSCTPQPSLINNIQTKSNTPTHGRGNQMTLPKSLVADSRSSESRGSRTYHSRDASPKSNPISAPTTPFHRDKPTTESIGRRSLRISKAYDNSGGPSNVRKNAVRSQSTRALRSTSSRSNTNLDADDVGENNRGGPWRRASAPRNQLERSNTSASLQMASKRRPSHSLSTTELRSRSVSARGSSQNLSTNSSTRPSESCMALSAELGSNEFPCSPRNSLENDGSTNLVSFNAPTLERIVERPSPVPPSTTPQARCTQVNNTAALPSPTISPLAKSPADSLNEIEPSRRPAYTSPTIASSRKITQSTQSFSNKTSSFVNILAPSGNRVKKAASTHCVETRTYNQLSRELLQRDIQSTLRHPVRQGSPFPHLSETVLTNSCNTMVVSPSNLHSPQSPQLARARWISNTSPKKQQQQSTPTDLASDNPPLPASRPKRPDNLFSPRSFDRTKDKQIMVNRMEPSSRTFSSGDPTTALSNSLEGKSYDARRTHTLPTLRHEKNDRSCFNSTYDAFHRVQEALDTALQRCMELKPLASGRMEEAEALRLVITEELEWRFTQLRAMLGLDPVCVEPPVARVLLADIVERLIPELRTSIHADTIDATGDSNVDQRSERSQREISYDWVVDSTTEATPLRSKLENDSRNVSLDHVQFDLSDEAEGEEA